MTAIEPCGFHSNESDFSDDEDSAISEIMYAIDRANDALTHINNLVNNKDNKLLDSLSNAYARCAAVRLGKEPRRELIQVIETIDQAKRTIEMMNDALENPIENGLTRDLGIASFNTFMILKRICNYKEYKNQ